MRRIIKGGGLYLFKFFKKDRPEITVDELAQKLPQVAVIDVRRSDEYHADHIPGAIHIPLDVVASLDLPQELTELKGQKIYIICRSGRRSARAVQILRQVGYQADNVVGGMLAWNKK